MKKKECSLARSALSGTRDAESAEKNIDRINRTIRMLSSEGGGRKDHQVRLPANLHLKCIIARANQDNLSPISPSPELEKRPSSTGWSLPVTT
jgi:hypothetical protein